MPSASRTTLKVVAGSALGSERQEADRAQPDVRIGSERGGGGKQGGTEGDEKREAKKHRWAQ
jgi:hypothetical protein